MIPSPVGRALRGRLCLLGLVLVAQQTAGAQSAGCARAHDLVEEIRRLYAAGGVDHAAILRRAKTATDLCPALGDAWSYAYCSAQALGDKRAVFYEKQAAFNGVSRLDCGGEAAAGAAAPEPLTAFVRDKFALVVGIGRFKDPTIQPLQFSAKDGRDFAAILTDPRYGRFDPSHVTLLSDEQATRENILHALNEIALRAKEDDLVLLYFSSHGSPRQDGAGFGGVGYIVTYDTSAASLWLNALEYEDLSRKVAWIKARRKIALLDTCFSGQANPGAKALSPDARGIDPTTARRFLSGEGTFVITSSSPLERSFESEALRNGYFTHYLIEALKTGSEPPTVREVFDQLSRQVPAAVLEEKRAAQHPQLLPEDGRGDVRIGVSPRAGEAPAVAAQRRTP